MDVLLLSAALGSLVTALLWQNGLLSFRLHLNFSVAEGISILSLFVFSLLHSPNNFSPPFISLLSFHLSLVAFLIICRLCANFFQRATTSVAETDTSANSLRNSQIPKSKLSEDFNILHLHSLPVVIFRCNEKLELTNSTGNLSDLFARKNIFEHPKVRELLQRVAQHKIPVVNYSLNIHNHHFRISAHPLDSTMHSYNSNRNNGNNKSNIYNNPLPQQHHGVYNNSSDINQNYFDHHNDLRSESGCDTRLDSRSAIIGIAFEEHEIEPGRKVEIETKSKVDLIRTFAHELRNPIHQIFSSLQLLSSSQPMGRQQQILIEDANESLNLLFATICDILDMSKIDSSVVLSQDIMHCMDIVETAADVFYSRCEEKAIDLFTYVDKRIPPSLLGDGNRIGQVLIGLLNNAIKYCNKGHVVLRAILSSETKNEATVEFCCEDTGIGIPQGELPKFNRESAEHLGHHNVHSIPSHDYHEGSSKDVISTPKGYGLGLTFCDRILTVMGCNLRIESQGVNQGSKFSFTVTLNKHSSRRNELNSEKVFETSHYSTVIILHHNSELKQILNEYLVSLCVEKVLFASQISEVYSTLGVSDEKSSLSDHSSGKNILAIIADASHYQQLRQITSFNPQIRLILLASTSEYCKYQQESISNQSNCSFFIRKPLKFSKLAMALTSRRNSFLNTLNWNNELMKLTQMEISSKSEKIEVLIVEDNPINQKCLVKILKKVGIGNIELACDGVECLEKVSGKEGAYSLILLDIEMPRMNGIEACKKIRALQDLIKRKTPIIAVTANAWDGFIQECRDAGMDDIVTKPVRIESFINKMSNFIHNLPTHKGHT